MVRKDPKVAGLINLIIWGGGYIYLEKRKLFGYGFILVEILEHIPILLVNIDIISYPYIIYGAGHLLLSALLAFDAYSQALEIK